MVNARATTGASFTKTPNDVLEAKARTNLSAHESRVLAVIERKTWGWKKAWDRISLAQYAEETGIDRRLIPRTLHRLHRRRLIGLCRQNLKHPHGLPVWIEDVTRWDVTSEEMSPETSVCPRCHQSRCHRDINPDVTPDINLDVTVTSGEMPTKETPSKETGSKETCHKKKNSDRQNPALARFLRIFPNEEHEQTPERHREKLARTRRFFLPDDTAQIWITPALPANTVKTLEDGTDRLIFVVGGPELTFDSLSNLYQCLGKAWVRPEGALDPMIESKPLPQSWLTALGYVPKPRRQKRVRTIPPDQAFADALVEFFRTHPVDPDAITRFPLNRTTDVWLVPGGNWPNAPTIAHGSRTIHLVGVPEPYGMNSHFASELRQFAALPSNNGNTEDRLVMGYLLPDTWRAMLRAVGVGPLPTTSEPNGISENGFNRPSNDAQRISRPLLYS